MIARIERLRTLLAPVGLIVLAFAIAAFAWWSLHLLSNVTELRGHVVVRVGWLQELDRSREALSAAESNDELLPIAQQLGSIADEIGEDSYANPDLVRESRAAEVRAASLASGQTPFDDAHRLHLTNQLASLPLAIRRETASLSRRLGEKWNALSILVTVSILSATVAFGLILYLYFVLLSRERSRVASLYRGLASVDRLAAAGTLASGVAHEVNNPLALLQASLAELEVTGAHSRERLATATVAGERIQAIIADLHCYAEASEDTTHAVRVRTSVDVATRLAASHLDGVDVDIDVADDLWILGSERRLTQTLHNLLCNSGEALRLVPPERRSIKIHAFDQAQNVRIEIIDRGPGIAPHVRRRAFEPFVTTKPVGQGTGLGLFVCHTLVTNMGGSINFDTGRRGTTVDLTLAGAPPPSERPRAASVNATVTRHRVLLVDDEAALGTALATSLRRFYDVDAVHSGQDALTQLERFSYDAVVSDVRMPGMSGPQLLERLRERWPKLASRVVFMTGGPPDGGLAKAATLDGTPCLSKPFKVQELRAVLRDLTRDMLA